ncbi:MAG: hypothetical protein KDA96_28925, partial [Planctomycetaceae bacterium]|nr:hypothetical protein [Planctomycetaceae bacterium]
QSQELLGPIVPPEALTLGAETGVFTAASFVAQHGLTPLCTIPASASAITLNAEVTAFSLREADEIRLRSALQRAVTYTISQQDPDSGGWRYEFGQEGDVSMFGWQMMSLKSTDIAGVRIHPVVRERMVGFLNGVRQGQHGGLFGYRRPVRIDGRISEPVTPAMTAEALFCQQMLGYDRNSAAAQEAVQYLL